MCHIELTQSSFLVCIPMGLINDEQVLVYVNTRGLTGDNPIPNPTMTPSFDTHVCRQPLKRCNKARVNMVVADALASVAMS